MRPASRPVRAALYGLRRVRRGAILFGGVPDRELGASQDGLCGVGEAGRAGREGAGGCEGRCRGLEGEAEMGRLDTR